MPAFPHWLVLLAQVEQLTSENGILSPIVNESPFYLILLVLLFGVGIYAQVIASRTFDFEKFDYSNDGAQRTDKPNYCLHIVR
jgi:uncharacterized membrane protein (DUF106 family)